ncbi:hypothetical protein [Maribacter sp. IgM3_T14_3]|uniref:hypothetical protein n=1 Tax=Maribacter sp. IgM3_T14_3 TaxID=3415140 RepID=UPI003C7004A5
MKRFYPKMVTLWAVLILMSCTNDKILEQAVTDDPTEVIETAVEDDGSTIRNIPGSMAPDVMENLGTLTGLGQKGISSGKMNYNNTRIQTDTIAEVMTIAGGVNYTFDILVKDAPANHLYNLVVHRTPEGQLEEPYVIAHIIDPGTIDDLLRSDGDLRYFKSAYTYHTFESFFSDSKYGRTGRTGDCGRVYRGKW